jgi:hypothetical protein
MSKYRFACFTCICFLCILSCTVTSLWGQDIDPEAVRQAIDRGINYLKRQQRDDGSWNVEGSNERCGTTAIAVLAMRSCGVPPNDPSIVRAMQYLRRFPAEHSGNNYSLALQTMAFCAVEPERDRALIRNNITLLERNQNKINSPHHGGWHYTPTGGGSDLSNAQFSILALYEAERVDIKISDATWRAALRYWSDTQNANGSWGYTPQQGGGSSSPRGSMSCAGIASLIIAAGVFERGGATVRGDQIICFQKPDSKSSEQIERGIDWLARNFTVSRNPDAGSYLLYYLYALERVGRMTNQRFIGRHDWYRAGTEKILALQDSLGDGHWLSGGGFVISDTAFALLFLSKGRRPVLMSKIQFGDNDAWNVHPNDVNNLTLFVESQWKLDMTWQIIDLQQATADHLLQSPVISFSARDWSIPPNEMTALVKKLRDYLDQGGFIIAEAQPGGIAFDHTFRTLMQRVFPEPGYELTLLERSHPIWTAEQTIDPDHLRPIEGIHFGCRTSVIYIPPVEGKPSLSCLWEVYRHFNRDGTRYSEVAQRQIDNGLGIGLNILAYATSRELKGKDEYAEQIISTRIDLDRRGRIVLPFLDYGATNPAPHAPQNLLRYLESEFKMRVEHQASSVTLSSETLADYPILFTHGRGTFQLTEEQHRRLRAHLERGGFLFANAICSAEPFATSFQAEMQKVFPNAQWERIPLSDPIFSDNYGGFNIDTLDVRIPERTPGQTLTRTRPMRPELYGIRFSEEDRWLIVFSPYDVSCALEKASSLECRGYSQRSALQLSANVILYALEHW